MRIYYKIFCMFKIMHNFDKNCSSQGFPESLLLALSVLPGEISTINSASDSGCGFWLGLLLFPNLFSSLPSTGPESGTNTHGHATRTRVQKRKRTTITGQTAEGLLAEAAFRENPGQRAGWDLQRRGSLSSWGLLPEQRHTVGRALAPGAYSAMTHFKDSKPIS